MGTPLDARDARRGQHPLPRLALVWTLLVFPVVFASEPLDEDFLLFLSDWTDDTGEFTPPSDVEETWADELSSQQIQQNPPAAEPDDQIEQGEPDA